MSSPLNLLLVALGSAGDVHPFIGIGRAMRERGFVVAGARAPELETRIKAALAKPGRPGVRKIAEQFGIDPGTVQRISRPFEGGGVAA